MRVLEAAMRANPNAAIKALRGGPQLRWNFQQ